MWVSGVQDDGTVNFLILSISSIYKYMIYFIFFFFFFDIILFLLL